MNILHHVNIRMTISFLWSQGKLLAQNKVPHLFFTLSPDGAPLPAPIAQRGEKTTLLLAPHHLQSVAGRFFSIVCICIHLEKHQALPKSWDQELKQPEFLPWEWCNPKNFGAGCIVWEIRAGNGISIVKLPSLDLSSHCCLEFLWILWWSTGVESVSNTSQEVGGSRVLPCPFLSFLSVPDISCGQENVDINFFVHQ
jgi:hypothetical protein